VIGTAATQVFSNAYTQAGGSITTTFNGVGASLEQAFSTLDTQAGARIATEIGTFSTAPAASLEPTVRYASGNGVTFTGTWARAFELSGGQAPNPAHLSRSFIRKRARIQGSAEQIGLALAGQHGQDERATATHGARWEAWFQTGGAFEGAKAFVSASRGFMGMTEAMHGKVWAG
jgi:hypothetical protein